MELKPELILWKLTAQSQEARNRKVIFFDPYAAGLFDD